MYDYQRIATSTKYGGAMAVFTGASKKGVTSGRYKMTLNTLPDAVNGCIPAGTPVLINDYTKVASVHYAFTVYEAVSYDLGATSMSIKLKKSFEGSRALVGMYIGLAPTAVTGEVAIPLLITAIDRTNIAYDVVTCSCSATAAEGTITLNATLVEVVKNEDDNNYYIKVLPNALTFYDIVKLPGAVDLHIDALFCQPDGVLLTRRVPPIAACIKAYLLSTGNVYVRFSDSKE